MMCCGCDSNGTPNCTIEVGEHPLVKIETEAGTIPFCSSVCRDHWEQWLSEDQEGTATR